MGGRSKQISELEASLVYTGSSRTEKPYLKKQKQTNKTKQETGAVISYRVRQLLWASNETKMYVQLFWVLIIDQCLLNVCYVGATRKCIFV